MTQNKNIHYLKDYTKPNYLVSDTNLEFIINPDQSVCVTSKTNYYKNPTKSDFANTLELNGSAFLISVALDGKTLKDGQFSHRNDLLTLDNLADEFNLTIITTIKPYENKSCMGLYESNKNLFTQCEPQGFRKITFYQDRPDVLATFTTTIVDTTNQYKVMLSNGNKLAQNTNDQGQHVVTWHDPFPKPSYLFALFAGNLSVLKDNFVTKSKRKVNLEVYVEKHDLAQAQHAMDSLKRAMKWDEDRFNLEYDLDTYMIVATSDFNMGAMENKGLNIFNTKYVLADKDSATDTDFINVELVVGHEYFHNWTGNRVTCRDWFQLSLKEGLTVFRDHEFTADLHNRGVKRISDVSNLRASQFPVDAGALAHCVRPESYLEINNFYTSTIYEKGAEVVRMYQAILGYDGFKQGLALYLLRHDGSAATCEDFCQAMMDANQFDLSQFMLWYSQAGTPHVKAHATYDARAQTYTLNFTQSIPDTPGQTNKKPMLIPIKTALFTKDGQQIDNLKLENGRYVSHQMEVVLLLDSETNSFTFKNIKTMPIPSLLREFSAPIKLDFDYSISDHLTLATCDSDEFNRFESLREIFIEKICYLYNNFGKENPIDESFWQSISKILNDPKLDPQFASVAFHLPNFNEMLTEIGKDINPKVLTLAIKQFGQMLGDKLFDSWMEIYNLNLTMPYKFDDLGKRALKNTALSYMMKALAPKIDNPHTLQLIETLVLGQYDNADNMTDVIAVLNSINNLDIGLREEILDKFYKKWNTNPLVMDKWLAIQAISQLVNVEKISHLMMNKVFVATNPNKIYALLRSFTSNGLVFNSANGYQFIAEQIIGISKFNPQVASLLASGFNQVTYLSKNYQDTAHGILKQILEVPNLCNDVYEIVSKTVKSLT